MMPTNVTIRYHRVLFTPPPRAAHLPFHPPISMSPRSPAAFASLSLQPYPRASPAISTTLIPFTSVPPV